MKVIIWTHGFDTHSKLDIQLDNINIYTLEEEGNLLWTDINEETRYRQEMFNNNSGEILDYMKRHIKINTSPNEMIFSFFKSFSTLNAGETLKHFIVYQDEEGYFIPVNTLDVLTLSELITQIKCLLKTGEELEIYCYTCRQDYLEFVDDFKKSGRNIDRLRVSMNAKRIINL